MTLDKSTHDSTQLFKFSKGWEGGGGGGERESRKFSFILLGPIFAILLEISIFVISLLKIEPTYWENIDIKRSACKKYSEVPYEKTLFLIPFNCSKSSLVFTDDLKNLVIKFCFRRRTA